MIVVDSSALLAIVFGEDDAERYANTIFAGLERRDQIRVPASVVVEAGIAAERHNYGKRLTALVAEIQPEIVPLTATIAELSVAAFRKFGRGIHKAGLNFGDCMTYARADYLKAPLLFKGKDFALTPIRSALAGSHLP